MACNQKAEGTLFPTLVPVAAVGRPRLCSYSSKSNKLDSLSCSVLTSNMAATKERRDRQKHTQLPMAPDLSNASPPYYSSQQFNILVPFLFELLRQIPVLLVEHSVRELGKTKAKQNNNKNKSKIHAGKKSWDRFWERKPFWFSQQLDQNCTSELC